MKPDWIGKLQHLLQTAAFCLAVATLQYAFDPNRPYGPPVAYSLAIGLCIWATIDLGRELMPSARETGWPPGAPGLALVVGGIVGGYFAGNAIGDALCRTLGLYGAANGFDALRSAPDGAALARELEAAHRAVLRQTDATRHLAM